MDQQQLPEADENEEEFDDYLGSDSLTDETDFGEHLDTEPLSVTNPLPYFVWVHGLLEGTLAHLRAADQLLYLHLVRETLGRGRATVQMTRRAMGTRTGLGKRAVEEALTRLISQRYVSLSGEGKGKIAANYRVYRRASPPRVPKPPVAKPSLESTLSQLEPEDYQALVTTARSLSFGEKKDIEAIIRNDFRSLGLQPTPPLLRQAFLYRVLEHYMFHKIRQKYPTMFS